MPVEAFVRFEFEGGFGSLLGGQRGEKPVCRGRHLGGGRVSGQGSRAELKGDDPHGEPPGDQAGVHICQDQRKPPIMANGKLRARGHPVDPRRMSTERHSLD